MTLSEATFVVSGSVSLMSNANFINGFAIAAIASEGEPDFACLSVIYKTYSGLSAGTISTTEDKT